MPFDATLSSTNSYRLVCPEGTETRPHVSAFLDWIETEFLEIRSLETDRRFV
jgi:hypothetical protein